MQEVFRSATKKTAKAAKNQLDDKIRINVKVEAQIIKIPISEDSTEYVSFQ